MMYILTEEEYQNLRQVRALKEAGIKRAATKKMQDLCTQIADTMPIKGRKKGDPSVPWLCKITVEREGRDHDAEWYCDRCPVVEICPHGNKTFSQ
jgi:hypothetical protein